MKSFLSEQRETLSQLMKEAGCRGHISLRRAGREEYLLASPVPLKESRPTTDRFIRLAQRENWETAEENGWILLAKELASPETRMIHPEGECAAVCSLLMRHPSGEKSRVMVYSLLKAADESAIMLELHCSSLHQNLSGLLREGRALPDLYGFLNDAIWRYEQC